VKFIFATTEAHKILPTILSRCQRFDLRPIPTQLIADHLLHIAGKEGIDLDQAAAWAIAKGADGGMRDAQSMLDQLVAFCGDRIVEENVLDVFGFTSREKVANLTTALLSRDTPTALSLIQKESESGRDLSQLLGELIGCLRALLVAKLDPAADGEGIPAELWQALLVASSAYEADRILAAIDVFAETESRMKWATNKRLHFELGVIKSIQSLGEFRITDVIKVLKKGISAGGDDFSVPVEVAPTQAAQVSASAPAPKLEEVKPVAAVPVKPVAKPAAKSKSSALDSLASLIESAPEVSEPIAPPEPPKPEPKGQIVEPPTPKEATADDSFYQDPLVLAALKKFEGKIVGA
jgi:DNA polymerase-3 subunit gamma/tau